MRHTVVIHRPGTTLYRANVVRVETDDNWIKLDFADGRVEVWGPVRGQYLTMYPRSGATDGHARTTEALCNRMSEDSHAARPTG